MLPEEQIISGEKQLKEFTKFLQSHDTLLARLIYQTNSINAVTAATSTDSNVNRSEIDAIPPQSMALSAKRKFIAAGQQCRPIGVDFGTGWESVATVDLIRSDNKCLNKMIIVFVQLCMEVRELIAEGNTLLTNCLFADEDLFVMQTDDDAHSAAAQQNDGCDSSSDRLDDGPLTADALCKISDILDLLCRTEHFVERCYVVIAEIIKQFSALFAPENKYYINVNSSSLHFQTVFNYLAEASVLIIKFDSVLKNGQLHLLWPHYAKAIALAEHNLHKFSGAQKFKADEIAGLSNVIQKIDYLFSGDLFQILIDTTFQKRSQIAVQAVSLFSNQFLCYLRNALHDVQNNLSATANLSTSASTLLANITSTTTTSIALGESLLNIMADSVIEPSKSVLKLNAMAILYHNLFGNLDQKLFASIVDCNTKFVYVPLIENLTWSADAFLCRYGSTLLAKIRGATDKMSATYMERLQQQWLQAKSQRLNRDTQTCCTQVATWILKMRSQFDHGSRQSMHSSNDLNGIKIDDLHQKMCSILQGIELMERLGTTINSVTNLHAQVNCPMTKQSIAAICKLIEFLKMLKMIFDKYLAGIHVTVQCLAQHQIHQALTIIAGVKKKFLAESASSTASYDEHVVDILSAMELAEAALFGCPSIRRMLMARLALSMTDPIRQFPNEQLNRICRLFASIEYLIQWQQTIDTLSSSSFIYWHHEALFPSYLRSAFDPNTSNGYDKISYFFHTAIDFHFDLMSRGAIEFQCSKKFMEKIATIFNQFVVAKVCASIETKLRLDVHTSLQLMAFAEDDPFSISSASTPKTEVPIADLRRLLQLGPISVAHSTVSGADDTNQNASTVEQYSIVKDHVGIYLSQMFYNLTTISMHDWRTYGQMRNDARHKFHLDTVEDHLPTQTLEQGLDVLEIMRNIHHFVSKYLYNLNNQIFIEKNSNNKHLNTINIQHIANSLRTHGIGIINTTVNFTYQFLHKKFYAFSQFLYNEQIQSRLMKDLKWFRDTNIEKPEEHQIYSYERACSFNKGIRRLGISENGQSLLDLFRQLITHIGNAMGYVRMMRSGGIHCCSNASVFLPIVSSDLCLRTMCEENKLPTETLNAAENLESDIAHLRRNYAEGTEYFRLLVDAFSPFFRSEKNAHLRLFYLIVPPLTLNYIEYIITAKEKMQKKTKQEGTWFTDDGFAMGLAYVLKLLNQNAAFNSLHWFKAVRQKYVTERNQLRKVPTGSNNGSGDPTSANGTPNYDAKLQQTLALSEKRIAILLREFDLLYCNLSSAKIFFQ